MKLRQRSGAQPDGIPTNSMTPVVDQPEHQLLLECAERRRTRDRLAVEVVLIIVILGLMSILWWSDRAQFPVLFLYFLPVTLAGFFLGRNRAGNTALLCVLSVVMTMWGDATTFDWLALSIWASVLGLIALVIGTLSDDQHREVVRLQEMHRTDTLSDALTQVANRRAFDYELKRRVTEWNRQRSPLSLMLLDIDRFKRLNDTHGHQAGDIVLREVASLIATGCRELDLVARYGGEEFGIIMPNTPAHEAMKVAERIRCGIEAARFEIGHLSIKATVSIGLSQIDRGEEESDLVQRADEALYASKQAGRNCSHQHSDAGIEPFGAFDTRTVRAADASPANVRVESVDEPSLAGRHVFIDELRRRLAESARYKVGLSIMLIRIDELADLTGGNRDSQAAVYNVLVQQASNVLRNSDLVATYSADEFIVLMPFTDRVNGLVPAVRLRQGVSQARSDNECFASKQVTISIGLTGAQDKDTVATVLQRLESALTLGVDSGGNRVVIVDDDAPQLVDSEDEAAIFAPPVDQPQETCSQ